MSKNSFFFKKNCFNNYDDEKRITKPFYSYLGYYFKDTDRQEYPVLLYFGKDEIAIYFTKKDGKVYKVFSLYVAEGQLNQNMLSKKIEDYALVPYWPLKKNAVSDLGEFYVDATLLNIGFFSDYFGFEYSNNSFNRIFLPGSRQEKIEVHADTIEFKKIHKKDIENDIWRIDEDGIKTSKVNFSKLLLDFLFELDYADTFEDENFYKIQAHIQDNLLLDALSKKCRYLSELHKVNNFSRTKIKQTLPKTFLDAEKEWLNVCRLISYKPVFVSPNSLFQDPEIEVNNVLFKARIGKTEKKRLSYLGSDEESIKLKNEASTFFMRKYDIISAFRVLLPDWCLFLLPLLLLFIPLGDFYLPVEKFGQTWYWTGFSSFFIPLTLLMIMIGYLAIRGINLFKLLLPRMLLGIMIGWSLFWGTEELWKKAFIAQPGGLLILNLILLTILFLYIFTDISNQTYKESNLRIAGKSVCLIVVAMLVSFVMGFYVVQFGAKSFLENSGFLQDNRLYFLDKIKNPAKEETFEKDITNFIDYIYSKELINNSIENDLDLFMRNYKVHKKYRENLSSRPIEIKVGPWEPLIGTIRYIWPVIFSQFIMSILFGIVLQMLWEDRPITEPL